jgi:glyoxalase family protein
MSNQQLITGIHHITAIASGSEKNLEFYAGILGLRLVKKTVNFDAPEVYHLYYGDETGRPGTILTFFPYEGLINGRHGKGMLNTTSFSVPSASVEFWQKRLNHFNIPFKKPVERFNRELAIYFEDMDGLGLELIFNDNDPRIGYSGLLSDSHCIRGFYSAEIWEEGYERTAGLLTEQLDHQLITEKGNRFRYAAIDQPGNYIDLVCSPDSLRGHAGSGTVHHIAFCTPDSNSQLELRNKILQHKLNTTPVLDRKYFTSIYFREPGGVLFEAATAIPGFTVDEDAGQLGEHLQLPEWLEKEKDTISGRLKPLTIDLTPYKE